MGETFESLLKEVSEPINLDEVTRGLTSSISSAIKNKHQTYGHPMIRDDHPFFHLMNQMNMIDVQKGTRTCLDDPSSKLTSGPRYWFLSQKAILYLEDIERDWHHNPVK